MAHIGELETNDDHKSGQFSLIDIFAAMTFSAILIAMFAPYVRAIDPAKRAGLIWPFILQIVILLVAGGYAFRRRQGLVEEGGKRFGVVYCGSSRGKQWPALRTCLLLLLLGVFQMALVVAAVFAGNAFLSIQTIQISLVFCNIVVRFIWRAYPGTIELFENGIITGDQLIAWKEVDVRPSQFHNDRVTMVFGGNAAGGLKGSITKVVFASEALKERIFAKAQDI